MSVLTYYPKNIRANGWGWHRGGQAAAVCGFLQGERGQGSSEPLLGKGSLYPTLPSDDNTVFNAGISKIYPQLPAEEYESGAVEEVVEESCAALNVNVVVSLFVYLTTYPMHRQLNCLFMNAQSTSGFVYFS